MLLLSRQKPHWPPSDFDFTTFWHFLTSYLTYTIKYWETIFFVLTRIKLVLPCCRKPMRYKAQSDLQVFLVVARI